MNKRILLLSSDHTGHGHKSIAQSLTEYLTEINGSFEVRTVNGFLMGARHGAVIEKSYIPLVTHAPFLWKVFFELSGRYPYWLDRFTAAGMERKLLELVRDWRPDLILTVHPGFVGSVHHVLEKHGIKIPVVVLIADLVTFSAMWVDKRSSCTICPTPEAKARLARFDLPESAVAVLGFPVRRQFRVPPQVFEDRIARRRAGARLALLVSANAFRKGRARRMVRTLLDQLDCRVTVITGRDDALKRSLARHFAGQLGDRLHLPGYVVDMERHMAAHDIMVTRAGPNTLMEAVSCGIPTIMTGHLPGQEEGNPDWFIQHGLGLVCPRIDALPSLIGELLADGGRRWLEIAQHQREHAVPNAARDTALFLARLLADPIPAGECPASRP